MGTYLNQDSKGNALDAKGKADALIADGATELPHPVYQPFLVCVIENTVFDAAAFCYSREEFVQFLNDGSPRKRRWLVAEAAVRATVSERIINEHLTEVQSGKQVPFPIPQTKEERAAYRRRLEDMGVAVFDLDDPVDPETETKHMRPDQ